ncbi:hypothetical protein G9A89_016465 [Geosiphon pyriformis]|nr:hypothetical protein G9A89_016465 [Geosiphon pyriformis]
MTIIHTNDVHSRVDQINEAATDCTPEQFAKSQCYGGTARHKTVIDRLRRRGKFFSLLMDGGDEFQGTMFYTYYKGNVTSQVMNLLGYNITAIGNHEFDNGPDVLAEHFKRLNAYIVCANIDASKNPNLGQYIKPYHIFEEYGIAVIGYITKTAGGISNAGPTLSFSDPIPIVQKYVDELHAKGIKRILTLSHNGYDQDKILAANTHGVAVHVGGHSHSFLSSRVDDANIAAGPYPTIIKNAKGEDTLIVQAFWSGKYIGHLDIVLDSQGKVVAYRGEPILIDQSIPQDLYVKKLVSAWRKPFDEHSKTVIGEAQDNFDQTRCQKFECEMGNLVADSMLWARSKNSDVVAAFINSGGIRAGLLKGNVTIGNTVTILPFGNRLVEIKLSGQNITDMLENVVGRKVNKISGKPVTSFIQVSGIQFQYDSSKEIYKRIVMVKIWDPTLKQYTLIDPLKIYTIVTVDFTARTGDGILPYHIGNLVRFEDDAVTLQQFLRNKTIIKPYLKERISDISSKVQIFQVLLPGTPLHYAYTKATSPIDVELPSPKHYKNILFSQKYSQVTVQFTNLVSFFKNKNYT